jgi:medium-chain acyl-[acyl-carrier-protein] hydrolase
MVDHAAEKDSGKSWFPFTTWETARSRMLCLPDAGGSASSFREWQNLVPPGLDLVPIEIPGHGKRFAEPPASEVGQIVAPLRDELLKRDLTPPTCIFGHSLGALLAFELARELESAGVAPSMLFVSGYPAPHLPWRRPKISHYDPPRFARALVEEFNADAAILNEDLLAMAYPALRADFEIVEKYTFPDRGPLRCPISVFGGAQDPEASEEELGAWRRHTSGRFQLRVFPGIHSFVRDSRSDLLGAISSDLAPLWDQPAH